MGHQVTDKITSWVQQHQETIVVVAVLFVLKLAFTYLWNKLRYRWKSHYHRFVASKESPFNYPHIRISPTIVVGFDWLDPKDIKCHEEYIETRHSALYNYLNSIDSPIIVPCIIVCSKSLTIIDGHHRFSVMKKLGWQKIPTLLLNYQHDDIITHPLRPIAKRQVERAGITQKYLPPKSTQHMVRDLSGGWHPIACLSLMVEYKAFDHLDTSQQRQQEADEDEEEEVETNQGKKNE
eukprot:TRINITY_DN8907_c0_g1_i1.p1 TRINITY_DN8907_c0_g1~~TRINITY_DN8907_c0_g1_i1.p1  ORF type:complete len:236 (-),score=37.89 TRINITY_DN8907_c0_g1_i1:34-741(-)